MKVILEIDHTVSKEEVVNWIEEVLKPNTPCVWGYSFEEHHCGSCHNSQLEKELAESKAQIEKMKNCMNCRNVMADDEGVCADCDIENGWKNWEFGE